MCAVIPHNLGKGSRWRAPVASPRQLTLIGIEPIARHRPFRRSITRRTWSLPAPPAPTMEDRYGRSSATRASLHAPRDPLVSVCR